jgi:tRNA-Thr(GGU) m(6)t(6)A37 methyltransferase TsaA
MIGSRWLRLCRRLSSSSLRLHPIGCVRSSLCDPRRAPRQGDEGAPDAWLDLDPRYAAALDGLVPGAEVVVLTWLHLADRDRLRVRPRDEPSRDVCGVFATRSPDRPNPIGLHAVEVLALDGATVHVKNLEAVDGTPVLDIKIRLGAPGAR